MRVIGVIRGSKTMRRAAAVAHPPQVVGGDRRALGDVGAGDEGDVRLGDVAPRDRRAVDAEGQLVGGARRDHAQPAVVVDVAGADGEARQLAHQVRLLGGQRGAAVDGHRVLAVALLDGADAADDEVERLVPAGAPEAALLADERVQQAVGVGALQVAPDALGAQHAAVEGELLPGLEADDLVVAHLELDAALLAAEAAVRLHQPVGRPARLGLEAAGRRIRRVRPVAGHQLGIGLWRPSQGRTPRAAAAASWRARSACTEGRGPASSGCCRRSGSRSRAR